MLATAKVASCCREKGNRCRAEGPTEEACVCQRSPSEPRRCLPGAGVEARV